MSIKNYDGFKLPSIKRVDHLLAFVNKLREEADSMAVRMYIRSVVDMASRIHDTLTNPHSTRESKLEFLAAIHEFHKDKELEDLPEAERFAMVEDILKWRKTPISFAMSAIETVSTTNNKKGLRCHYDFGYSLVILQGRRKLLGMPFAQRREYIDLLMSKDGVEEYGYWNNVDPPEGMTWSKFKRRGEEWDEAWNRCKSRTAGDIPSMNGMTFEIVLNDQLVRNYQGIFTWVENQDNDRSREAHAVHLAHLNEMSAELAVPRLKRFVRQAVKRQIGDETTELGRIFREVNAELAVINAAFNEKAKETGSMSGWFTIHDAESALLYVLEDRTKDVAYLNRKLKNAGVTAMLSEETFARYLEIATEIEKELAPTFNHVLSYEDLKTPINDLMKE